MSRSLFDKCVKERDVRAVLPKVVRRGNHWYTRHHMWTKAVGVRALPEFVENGVLEYLEDLTFEERREALRRTDEQIRKNENVRKVGNAVFIDQGYGPARPDEVDDADFAAYNGRDGGKVWRWYEPTVFHGVLQEMGVSVETCTERQCTIALRRTSGIVGGWGSAYLQGLA